MRDLLFEDCCSPCSRIAVEHGEQQSSNAFLAHPYLSSNLPVKSSNTNLQTTSLGTLSRVRELVSTTKENEEQVQGMQALIPIVQDTITFHGKPLVVVRLPDGQPGVVLRWICENLHLAPKGQVERIKRTEVIASDLVYVRVQTEGGFQTMPTLVLHSTPYWLATIDTRRMEKDDPRRLEILSYQRDAVDALYEWARSPANGCVD
jgi:hypothetical protein